MHLIEILLIFNFEPYFSPFFCHHDYWLRLWFDYSLVRLYVNGNTIHCSLVHKGAKVFKFHTHHSRARWAHQTQHHKSTLNTISIALPWLFCQGHLWSCNYTTSCASTFKNDLEYRVHVATLIILMLIGSTVACLFQGPGWTEKNTKELKIDVEPLHAITHWRVYCQCGCWLWAEWKWVLEM